MASLSVFSSWEEPLPFGSYPWYKRHFLLLLAETWTSLRKASAQRQFLVDTIQWCHFARFFFPSQKQKATRNKQINCLSSLLWLKTPFSESDKQKNWRHLYSHFCLENLTGRAGGRKSHNVRKHYSLFLDLLFIMGDKTTGFISSRMVPYYIFCAVQWFILCL